MSDLEELYDEPVYPSPAGQPLLWFATVYETPWQHMADLAEIMWHKRDQLIEDGLDGVLEYDTATIAEMASAAHWLEVVRDDIKAKYQRLHKTEQTELRDMFVSK
jgi:hypothetical protein